MTEATRSQAILERPDSNTMTEVTVVPVFPSSSPEAAIPRSPRGSSGMYKVTFVLARPGILAFHSELDFAKLMDSGDSFLDVPAGILPLTAILPQNGQNRGVISFATNETHRLAKAEVQIMASSFEEAERVAYSMVLPIISWWSFRFDVALDINGYQVDEIATQTRKWVFGIEGGFKPFTLGEADEKIQFNSELRPIFAAYREGLSATNLFYQCLSFYKVTEAIKSLRNKRHTEAKAAGRSISDPAERLPDQETDPSIPGPSYSRHLFRPHLGKKYTTILDQFRELIRNAVAHLNPLEDVLAADDYDDVIRCRKAIPVLKFIAREMLKHELLAQFGDMPVSRIS